MSYLIPAPYTGMSSRDAHLRRNPPSSEPGTDYYMPTGTPLAAPTRCRVVDIGGNIEWATGRYLTVDDGTRWIRFLHMLERHVTVGDELDAGQIFGLSGASGYGSEFFGESYRNDAFWANTGGDHVHVTAFRGRGYTFGSSGTVDFHAMTGGIAAGGSSEEDDMYSQEDRIRDMAVYAAVFGPQSVGATQLSWVNSDGARAAGYGVMDIIINNQQLIATQSAKVGALEATLAQLSAGSGVVLDMAAIEAAAERGAAGVLSRLVLRADPELAAVAGPDS